MKLLYKPFGLIAGLVAAFIGRKLFDFLWSRVDEREPPKATTQQASWPKIIGAAALEGLIFKTTRVVVDRYGARGWYYLTGSWPGEKKPEKKDD